MPPKVERWSPGLIGIRNFGTRGEGAQREAVGDAFGCHQNVRNHAVVFDGKHLAGAAKTGLNLVRDKQDAVLIEDLLYFFEIIWWRHEDSAFAHDRLGYECGNISGSGEADHIVNALAHWRPHSSGSSPLGTISVGSGSES